jgi:hypothetical protein
MSSSASDTQQLDEKKQNQTNSSNTTSNKGMKNIGTFLLSVFFTILLIVGYFIFGSMILYECKLAQSNILPTNLECYPYTENYPQIQKVLTNIFITNTDPQESVKLSFPYDKTNSKNKILDAFRKYKEQPKSNFLVNYFIAVLEALINYSNNALTVFFNLLNTIPEILIIVFGPIISCLYFGIAPIIGFFVFVYYYFYEMKWFFKENTNTNPNSKSVWSDVTLLEPIGYGISVVLVFVFFILFWILLFTIMPITVIIVFYICLLMTLGYKGEIDNKNVTILTIVKDVFKYYKVTISVIFSIIIIISAFSNLGALPGVFSILVVLLIYFGFIPIKLFEYTKATNVSPLSSFEQAKKVCNENIKPPKTFFERMENLFHIKGGGIGKELKKLNKKMKA